MRVVLDPVKKPDTMEPEDGEEGRWGAGGAIVVARALDSFLKSTNSRWRMICERDSSVRHMDRASFSRASLYLTCEFGEVEKELASEDGNETRH